MHLKEWFNMVAYIGEKQIGPYPQLTDVWLSKYDDSYITHIGFETTVKHLADRDITEELTHGVGFSPTHQKWYGWSHRAIYGFGIGSTCKKGDSHYVPVDEDDFLNDCVRFWEDEYHEKIWAAHTPEGVRVYWSYSDEVPNKNLRGTTGGQICPYPEKYGKGEWVAETLEDAKQMAIDFNDGVS